MIALSQVFDSTDLFVGHPFSVEHVKIEDLEEHRLTSSWSLEMPHRAVSEDKAAAMLEEVTIGLLLSTAKGAWEGSSELNRLFPEYRFTSLRDFLAGIWGKE